MGRAKRPKQKNGNHIESLTSILNVIAAILNLVSAIIIMDR